MKTIEANWIYFGFFFFFLYQTLFAAGVHALLLSYPCVECKGKYKIQILFRAIKTKEALCTLQLFYLSYILEARINAKGSGHRNRISIEKIPSSFRGKRFLYNSTGKFRSTITAQNNNISLKLKVPIYF